MVFCQIFCVSFLPVPSALAQAGPDLPEGHYIFQGVEPGKSPQKAFFIDSKGAIHWADESKSTSSKTASKNTWKPKILSKFGGSSDDDGGEWISRDYPLVKWRPQAIETIPDAVAQLSTTALPSGVKGRVTLKYNLLLGGIDRNLPGVQFEFRDKDGFTLFQVVVPARNFQTLLNQPELEATGQWPNISEDDYKKARQLMVR